MRLQSSLRNAVLGTISDLHAPAVTLSYQPTRADNLVQEAPLRAGAKMDSFDPGTSMRAWLLSVSSKDFFSEYRRLERANSLKNEILGTIAHDLKNPMQVIMGRADILAEMIKTDPSSSQK